MCECILKYKETKWYNQYIFHKYSIFRDKQFFLTHKNTDLYEKVETFEIILKLICSSLVFQWEW